MPITNGYATLEMVKLAAGNIADANDDQTLELAINAASRQIDSHCGQRFWIDEQVVAREFFVNDDGKSIDLWQDDVSGIATATGLIVKTDSAGNGGYATTLTSGTDFLLMPRNAALVSPARPYTSLSLGVPGATTWRLPTSYGRPAVKITAKWGWPAVPDEVEQACVLQAIQLWKAREAVFGVIGFGEFGAIRAKSAMNPIAEDLLAPFRRVVFA